MRAVPLGAVVGQFLLDVAVAGRADEVQVLEQVRHAGFAVALEPRADQVGHVDRDLRVRRIGKQQDAQAVGIGVFGDAAQGRFLFDAARQGLRERRADQRQHEEGLENRLFHAHGKPALFAGVYRVAPVPLPFADGRGDFIDAETVGHEGHVRGL